MQARAIAAQSVTQWTVGIRPTWRISEVRAALQQHANGDFRQSAQLVDSFGEDDLLPGLFERRADAVLGSDFEFLAVDAPTRQQSQRLADRYEPLWWDMFPESELAEFIKWYRALGVAVAGGVFGALALSKRDDVSTRCAPLCQDRDLRGIKDLALAADVSFGLALLGAGVTVYSYVTRPEQEPARTASMLQLSLTWTGTGVAAGGRF